MTARNLTKGTHGGNLREPKAPEEGGFAGLEDPLSPHHGTSVSPPSGLAYARPSGVGSINVLYGL